MIIYDLKCDKDHTFEGWFNDRAAFEDQKTRKLITCPICGSSEVEMVPSSVTIMGKDLAESRGKSSKDISPIKALQLFHEYLDKNFSDVGNKFAEIALKIHRGEEDKKNIKGTTTKSEEETLKEEGVQFIKVPIPKFDS
ncbi:MAG: DUF1178 family protein [Thermodesulfobacteriota bacterium]|nr:DUF1178 family protein [Thermodesulfobacteriota bacterium]